MTETGKMSLVNGIKKWTVDHKDSTQGPVVNVITTAGVSLVVGLASAALNYGAVENHIVYDYAPNGILQTEELTWSVALRERIWDSETDSKKDKKKKKK